MGYTSTGDASEHMAWNSISQQVGYEKVLGKEIGIPQMPAYEGGVVTAIREMQLVDLHQAMAVMVEKLHAMLFFADPMVKFVPMQLDPNVEYIVRLDGRWHVAIWLPASVASINVAFPGMQSVAITTTVGWNVLTCPDGTKLYSATANRVPAYMRYANRGIAA
jgi:hypothetical protein